MELKVNIDVYSKESSICGYIIKMVAIRNKKGYIIAAPYFRGGEYKGHAIYHFLDNTHYYCDLYKIVSEQMLKYNVALDGVDCSYSLIEEKDIDSVLSEMLARNCTIDLSNKIKL